MVRFHFQVFMYKISLIDQILLGNLQNCLKTTTKSLITVQKSFEWHDANGILQIYLQCTIKSSMLLLL